MKQRLYILEGACCTGKTTLADDYALRSVSELIVVPEAAREFYQKNIIPEHLRSSLDVQKRIQEAGIIKIAQGEKMGKPLILADSSPLSSIAYASLNPQDTEKKTAKILLKNIENWLPKVELFFLTDPSDVNYLFDWNDNVRKETPEQRLAVHHALLTTLQSINAPFMLLSGSLEERRQKIDNVLFTV